MALSNSDLGLARVQRDTVQERIYVALREKLMRGGFEPGQGLKVVELAHAFGTSAMPVRSALSRLTAERALEDMPNRTVRVPSLSMPQLLDLSDARCAVEGLAIERASQSFTEQMLADLERTITDQEHFDLNGQPAEAAEQNQIFHFTIYRQAGSPVLLAIIESLWLQSGPYLRTASSHLELLGSPGVKFHIDIIDALRRRDGAAARKWLEDDIRRSFQLAARTLDEPNPRITANG